jgi:ubiquinone/menaquinone biosynthesis C-methylase UbiE
MAMKEKKLIIVGCQRSGTSALWKALRAHSEFQPVKALPADLPKYCDKEIWHINDFFLGRTSAINPNRKCHNNSIDKAFVNEFFAFTSQFIQSNYGSRTGGWVYSHPSDGLYADEILTALPTVKLIFLIRHPQEVVWSSLHAPWEPEMNRENFLTRTKELSNYWNKFAEAHEKVSSGNNKDRILTIYNEDLRKSPEDILNKIYQFMELRHETSVLKILNSGTFNSSFYSNGSALSRIGTENAGFGLDHEYNKIVTQCCNKYMRIHGYKPLVFKQNVDDNKFNNNNSENCNVQLFENSSNHPNEDYWRSHIIWYKNELTRRRGYIPAYLSQEVFLDFYFRDFARDFIGEKGKILEYGFGFGRHLRYLNEISGLDLFGCDISRQALEVAEEWADIKWIDQHLKIIEPRKILPYSDKGFDVTYTVSVLIHINPDDIEFIARELSRITKKFILHIENPFTKTTYKTSEMHEGCWAHSLVDIYEKIGFSSLKLPTISTLFDIYLIVIDSDYKLPLTSNIFNTRLFQLEKNYLELESKHEQIKANLKGTVDRFNNTRTAKIQHWLSTHPLIEKHLTFAFDRLKHINSYLFSKQMKSKSTEIIDIEINESEQNVLTICHPKWQGVRSSSEGQSRNRLFLSELEEVDILIIVDSIIKNKQQIIIFNGFWKGYDKLMVCLKEHCADIYILYVHHGSFYQMNESRDLPTVIDNIYRLYQRGVIDRVGFVKKGMADAFCQLGGKAQYVMNYVEPEPNPIIKSLNKPIRVGIPVEDSLRKNVHTQVVAALLISEVDEIHLWHQPDYTYLASIGIDLSKVIVHSNCSREKTRSLLNQMTFTMYVTISECYPMVVMESFAAATPCFSSYTHGILEDMPELAKQLMIPCLDNPVSIANHIKQHIPLIPELSKHVLEAYYKISIDAQQSIRQFSSF